MAKCIREEVAGQQSAEKVVKEAIDLLMRLR